MTRYFLPRPSMSSLMPLPHLYLFLPASWVPYTLSYNRLKAIQSANQGLKLRSKPDFLLSDFLRHFVPYWAKRNQNKTQINVALGVNEVRDSQESSKKTPTNFCLSQ